MPFSLPSIIGFAASPSFRLCCLNRAERFDLIIGRPAVVGSWEDPPNIYLIDGSEKRNVFGEQGWRSGDSAHLPPVGPGFDSRTQCLMWAEFVGSLLCSERNSGFPLSSKTNI